MIPGLAPCLISGSAFNEMGLLPLMTPKSYTRHLQTYRQNHAATVDPGTLLILLYQGTIDFVRQARESLGRKNMADKGFYVLKALAIIAELRVSLNFEVGGQVALNL